VICDRYRCTYSDVDIKCSSITDNQSLKLSKVYSSLFVDFHKLLGHLFRWHLVYSSFVYHTVLMQMQWIVLQKRAFLCPRAPPYNKVRCPRGSAPLVRLARANRHERQSKWRRFVPAVTRTHSSWRYVGAVWWRHHLLFVRWRHIPMIAWHRCWLVDLGRRFYMTALRS